MQQPRTSLAAMIHGTMACPRLPIQLGYKNLRFLHHITVTDSMKSFGKGLGSASPEGGYAWFVGI